MGLQHSKAIGIPLLGHAFKMTESFGLPNSTGCLRQLQKRAFLYAHSRLIIACACRLQLTSINCPPASVSFNLLLNMV